MDLKCPRCDSKNHYFATRQIFKGKGVFLRARNVEVALCRKCGETMVETMPWQNQDLEIDSYEWKYPLVAIVGLLLLAIIYSFVV